MARIECKGCHKEFAEESLTLIEWWFPASHIRYAGNRQIAEKYDSSQPLTDDEKRAIGGEPVYACEDCLRKDRAGEIRL